MQSRGGSEVKGAFIGCLGVVIAAIISLGTPLMARLVDIFFPPPATSIATPPTVAPRVTPNPPPQTPPAFTPMSPTPVPTIGAMPKSPTPSASPGQVSFDLPTPEPIIPADQAAIANFLAYANQVEIYTRATGDFTYADNVFAGAQLAKLEQEIATLREQGVVQLASFDGSSSAIRTIKRVDEVTLAVDTCEIWSATYKRLLDDSIAYVQPATLFPQTITLEDFDGVWLITYVEHYPPPHFCQ
ncbi:hypothetical protein [Kallotenue papyrolyticum]|uniref:hypothetical protein n=1 Tax=Kallotenue papyrolyticum TaxID=1325125 RepID=UPI000492AADB|nr:hypothetical protein [Kallotenue papyrolyticum]